MCHLLVERSHELVLRFHDGDSEAPLHQLLGAFEADVAAADDQRLKAGLLDVQEVSAFHLARQQLREALHDRVHIRYGPAVEDVWAVEPGDRWHDRNRAGGENQAIVGERGPAFVPVDVGHRAVARADPDDLRVEPHIHPEEPGEAIGVGDEQGVTRRDLSAHVVGQTTVGVAHVRAAIEHDDLDGLVCSSRFRCC